jgi:hypothetical protein
MCYSNLGQTLFLDIFSTNTDTLVPSLYQYVKTRSTEVFSFVSANSASPFQPFDISETFAAQLRTALSDKHFPT